jgi:large subunit ribosomal protein L5
MSEKDKDKQEKKPKAEGQKGGGAPKGGGGNKPQKQPKKPKGGAAAQEAEVDDGSPQQPAPPARLIAAYREQVVPALTQKFGYRNQMSVPKLEKIVISMGLGKAAAAGEKAKIEQAEKELGVIAGQRPVRCKAKKSVANFKIREGQETGLKVTLRGSRMYEFLDRVISVVIPRVKDFRGLNPNGFDKNGNYNFGFTEQTVFPEVDAAAVTFQQGMNITMVTTARKPEEGRELLRQFGFPFRGESEGSARDGKAVV